MTELAERTEHQGFLAEYQAVTETEGGAPCLQLPPTLPFDKYREVVRLLGRITGSVPFYVGDAALHGEAQYGEAYSQAMDDFGLAYQTMANYTHVCRWVEPDVRRGDLSFGHHAAVANMVIEKGGQRVPDKREQRKWLAMAAEKDWSRAQLREAIAASQQQGKGKDEQRRDQDAERDVAAGRALHDEQGGSNGKQQPEVLPAPGQQQPVNEAWLQALRDVYDASVPLSQVAQHATDQAMLDSYWAVPIDIMEEVAQALGEEWAVAPPEPAQQADTQPPVIDEAALAAAIGAQQVQDAPSQPPPAPAAPAPAPAADDGGLGETFEL